MKLSFLLSFQSEQPVGYTRPLDCRTQSLLQVGRLGILCRSFLTLTSCHCELTAGRTSRDASMLATSFPMEREAATLFSVEFEWDPKKAALNRRKHGISFDEAATVFGDLLGTTLPDPDHSLAEDRYITIGMSNRRRLVMVAHTERRQRIRIVSARELTRSEREAYEEETK